MHACLFNIQRFSIHDGPGIRTTVFFKGCPMRCLWCSNPESIRPEPEVMWQKAACTGCRACVTACPVGAVVGAADGPTFDRVRCTACGACLAACPHGALTMAGKLYSLEEVTTECQRDRDFFEESGGGVTLSGGEATAQADFAAALLRRLRDDNVHTAIETNGVTGRDAFRKVAALADLILFDIKHHDPDKHREGTGRDIRAVCENLRWLVASDREVVVRIPVIRGYSETRADAAAFARLLGAVGVRRAQLLPFHQMGQNKYAMIGRDYALADQPQMRKEELAPFRDIMLEAGMAEVIV
ncbi:MAG: glycyl-radical enzyme activating protein [Planctomycetes bacterium]|nr:glycyl-radical enzyme activating protein [Planctomycetota bacterium]